ncbi:uncharacterized protein LOC113474322 [Ciona intestinalis]
MGVINDDLPPNYEDVTIQVPTDSVQPDTQTQNGDPSTGNHVRFANFNRVVEIERIPDSISNMENCMQSLKRMLCIGCCGNNTRRKSEISIIVSFIIMMLVGFVQLGIGLASVVEGTSVSILSGILSLNTFGICMVIGGVLLSLLSLLTLKTIITTTDTLNLSTTGLRTLIIGYIYILLFAGASAIIISEFTNQDFVSKVILGINDTLTGHTVSSGWSEMQERWECCGTTSYTDWLYSKWAKNIYKTDNINGSYAVLPNSCVIDIQSKPHCVALVGRKVVSGEGYVVLSGLKPLIDCAFSLNPRYEYIYATACSTYYVPYLTSLMRSMLITDLCLLFVVFSLFILLYNVASHLPSRQRVAAYSVQT